MNKTAIKNFAIAARLTLIDAVTQRAFEYEVTKNGKNNPDQAEVNGKALTPTELSQRKQLIDRIRQNGFAQTMEETAYTWFNRFIALRFMEINGYLPTRIRVFTDENNAFKPEILAEASRIELDGIDHDYIMDLLDAQQNDTLYKYLLIAQCNALNVGLPEMFEEIGGWTELLFPNNLLRNDSVIAHMVEDIPEDDWRNQVQIIGWLYQYYNTEPKDKVFADLKKNIKISAEAIPAATQLFTPDWIVRYMVENSLGRLWTEGHGKPENADWKYYLEEAEQEDSVKAELEKLRAEYRNIQPEQIRFLDPCMGSGHILVYAFDVLMDIYTSCGWSERDAALSILRHNLYGLDIDRRAYQLAYFAVMMKARQYNRSIIKSGEVQPQLANFADVMGVDTDLIPGKIREFAEQFAYADTYGSLMEIAAPSGLDEAVSEFNVSFGMSRKQLDMMVMIYKILSQKYDVVCTNPPYMGGSGMNAKLSDFVKKNFPDSKSDLFATFIEKGLTLTKKNGFSSMVTMQSWMFLSSFENMRTKLLNADNITNLMHMENMVMGIAFGTAVSIFRNNHITGYKGTYNHIKLSNLVKDEHDNDIPASFPIKENRFAQVSTENFSKIPGMPVACWVSENFIRAFEYPTLGNVGKARSGLQTGNNDLFLKYWQEVSFDNIAFNMSDKQQYLNSGKKWTSQIKGGDYRKWYGNFDYIVNWQNNGAAIRSCSGCRLNAMGNDSLFFIEGLTWSHTTSSVYGARYLPTGHLFNVEAPTYFIDNDKMNYTLGFLNSCVAQMYLNVMNSTMHYLVGNIMALPFIYVEEKQNSIDEKVEENIEMCRNDWDSFETSWDFEKHPLI